MKNKIINKKTFKEFEKFMSSNTKDSQKERAAIYESYGGLNANSKAKYIVEKVGPYIYGLVSKIEEDVEEVDSSEIIEELQKCFFGIKKMLKAEEQLNAFENEFKSLNFEKKFQELENSLSNHKKDIFKFTNSVFSSIIEDLNDDMPPDLLRFKDNITSEEIYDFIRDSNGEKDTLSQEDYNIGKIIIRALAREKASLNVEVIGRVYAYVKSGWAKADLYDKEGIKDNKILQELNSVIEDIKLNPYGRTESEKEKDDERLAKAFSQRLSQVSVTIIYKRNEGEFGKCYAKEGALKEDRVAQSGTADVVILDRYNPSVLHQVYCTANAPLYYTEHGSNSNSMLSHQIINSKELVGKSIKEIDVSDNLKSILGDKVYNTKIEKVDVVNIAPGLLSKPGVMKEFTNIFKKKSFSVSEISTVNQFPLIYAILKYKPDNEKGVNVGIDDILNIKESIILNDKEKFNFWEKLSTQSNVYGSTKEQKEQLFYSRHLVSYLDDVWTLIKNKEIKDTFVVSNQNNNVGEASFFIKELPEMLNLVAYKISEDADNGTKIFNKSAVTKFVGIVEELLEHPNFNSQESKNTLGKTLKSLKMYNNEIKDNFNVVNKQTFKRK